MPPVKRRIFLQAQKKRERKLVEKKTSSQRFEIFVPFVAKLPARIFFSFWSDATKNIWNPVGAFLVNYLLMACGEKKASAWTFVQLHCVILLRICPWHWNLKHLASDKKSKKICRPISQIMSRIINTYFSLSLSEVYQEYVHSWVKNLSLCFLRRKRNESKVK